MIDLTAAGLSETEAKCYAALLEQKDWKPSELAKNVGETRTNCYKILDKLVGFGLAERFDKSKVLHYRATNPSRLLELARAERTARETAEQQLEVSAEQLIGQYIRTHEQPGVRFFQGKNGIKAVFEDMLDARQDIYLLRSPADVGFYDEAFFNDFRARRAALGITTHAITPLTHHAKVNMEHDTAFNFVRTIIPASAYTGATEWNAYGDKLAIISYGTEAIAMVIESPQIAESFRQLFGLLSHSPDRHRS